MTTADIIAELAKQNEELEREVARLRGVIEGMEKRRGSWVPYTPDPFDHDPGPSSPPHPWKPDPLYPWKFPLTTTRYGPPSIYSQHRGIRTLPCVAPLTVGTDGTGVAPQTVGVQSDTSNGEDNA